MTFRTRIFLAFICIALIPVVVLTFFVRSEMTDRIAAQYEQRVQALVGIIEDDLHNQSQSIAAALAVVREAVRDDNRFRRAAVDRDSGERRYLLDYAGEAMRLAGLAMLQIQDDSGRILSSGHFRNEYDRLDPELPALLAETPDGTALVRVRAPDAPFLALCRCDSLRLGERRFTIVGGIAVQPGFLTGLVREGNMAVSLHYPGGELGEGTSADDVLSAGELRVPFIDSGRGSIDVATFRVTHDAGELRTLRDSINRWFVVAVAATAVLAMVVVGWLAARFSRPLVELADKTSHIDLDRLDVDFGSTRRDEIGVLSRMLGAMTARLRASAAQIKDAERRATLGELARQVNHDIRNGLTPIRNVLRHLAEVAEREPTQVGGVFAERRATLDTSISYLDELASNYARLSRHGERAPCDLNRTIGEVVADRRDAAGAVFNTALCDGAVVLGDAVSLRRVVENLVDNAVDSLEGRSGEIAVSTRVGDGRVLLVVRDTGSGMSPDQRTRIFEDFYTTKDDGTGLGLSIVRRLVMDLDGSIEVETELGKGSCFTIDLPAYQQREGT